MPAGHPQAVVGHATLAHWAPGGAAGSGQRCPAGPSRPHGGARSRLCPALSTPPAPGGAAAGRAPGLLESLKGLRGEAHQWPPRGRKGRTLGGQGETNRRVQCESRRGSPACRSALASKSPHTSLAAWSSQRSASPPDTPVPPPEQTGLQVKPEWSKASLPHTPVTSSPTAPAPPSTQHPAPWLWPPLALQQKPGRKEEGGVRREGAEGQGWERSERPAAQRHLGPGGRRGPPPAPLLWRDQQRGAGR